MNAPLSSEQVLWNRCDVCGRFIALSDFDDGATRKMVTPDSFYSSEDYETLCKRHSPGRGLDCD